MKKVAVAELILDYNLYPRASVDSQHAYYMGEALKAGIELPPIIVDEKSKRVVDGFHRVTATRKLDKSGSITAIFKKYRSEAEMFVDAMKYNASHGRALTQYDRTHCILRARSFNLTVEAVASALSISVDKVAELTATRVASTVVPSTSSGKKWRKTCSTTPVQLKRTIEHMSGRELKEGQVEANKKLSGMNQSFYAQQIILLIEEDLLDYQDVDLIEKLRHLHELIGGVLVKLDKKAKVG